MKKWFALLLACLLLVIAIPPVSAASVTASVKAGSGTVKVGNTVTVTVTHTANTNVAAFDATVNYDAAVLEYVSASGASVSGGAGVLKVSYFATAAPSGKSHSFTLTFKAKATGSSKVSVSSTGISDWNLNSLGSASASTTVSVQNPSLSNNANLTELYVSSGSLSPAFSSKVTSYNITIPYSVTVLTVSAVTADKNAKVEVTGSKNMQVGKNTRVVKVTAPDGTVKSYTLNITRQENTGAATDTEKEPTADASKVTVGEETRYIASDLKGIPLPTGYEQVELTVNDVKFPSVQDKSRAIVLLYLFNEQKSAGEFFVYDTGSMTFSPFASVNMQAGTYAFLTPDNTVTVPEGFTQTFITVNQKTVVAWSFPGQTEPEQYLVYALSPNGNKGLYRYDSVEGTFLRYVADTAVEPSEPDEDLTEEPVPTGFIDKVKQTVSGWAERLGKGRMIAIAAGAGLLLVGLIVLIVLLVNRPKDYKH